MWICENCQQDEATGTRTVDGYRLRLCKDCSADVDQDSPARDREPEEYR